ncbi:MAG: hypothetical protein GX177_08915 [Firmicutes bacterium]|jgi:uncharacterized membrane protein|nr:hypothetical protein [Bacillota bacterium]
MRRDIRWIVVGGVMLVLGWLIIFGAVIDIIPPIVWLAFAAYALSLAGFVVGIIGVIMYMRFGQKK